MSRYWTEEEHERFLEARRIFGLRNTKAIAEYVGTRTVTQVRTHTQKYERRQEIARKNEGPGFRVRSRSNSMNIDPKVYRRKNKSSRRSTFGETNVSSSSGELENRLSSEAYYPYSVQYTNHDSEKNWRHSNQTNMEVFSFDDNIQEVPSQEEESYISEKIASGTLYGYLSDEDTKSFKYDEDRLSDDLPFWQTVVSRSSFRKHSLSHDKINLCNTENWTEENTDMSHCAVNVYKKHKTDLLDIENVQSTEDLQNVLLDYFQQKPNFVFDSLNSYSSSSFRSG
eukprot:jgi/Galph1/5630/GphlegSOOS_G4279.1